jgi:hypothetical protein
MCLAIDVLLDPLILLPLAVAIRAISMGRLPEIGKQPTCFTAAKPVPHCR